MRCLTWSLLSAYHIGNLEHPKLTLLGTYLKFIVAICHKTLENRSAQIKCRSTGQFHYMSIVWLRGVQAQMQVDSGAYPKDLRTPHKGNHSLLHRFNSFLWLEGGLCRYKSAGLIEIGTLVLQDAMLSVIFVVRTGPLTLNIFNGILFSHQPPEISIEDGMQFCSLE